VAAYGSNHHGSVWRRKSIIESIIGGENGKHQWQHQQK